MQYWPSPRTRTSAPSVSESGSLPAGQACPADKDLIKIASNLDRLNNALDDSLKAFVDIHAISGEDLGLSQGSIAQKIYLRFKRAIKLFYSVRNTNIVILSGSPGDLINLCLFKFAVPNVSYKLVSIDLILQKPRTMKQYVLAKLRRIILSKVDLFINHFRHLQGYESIYGISHDRSVYIPFKVNEIPNPKMSPSPAGDYVLCTGRTRRDVKTFVEAIRLSGCPGLLHQESAAIINSHGTATWQGEIPENLTYIIDDCKEAFINYISNARIVVIPRFRDDIAPAGIATYLSAMIRRRCCVLSEGPGHDDVLTGGQAVIVEPEDPEQLAKAIRRLWEDDELRTSIAERGYAYAQSVGDERRLHSDILTASLALLPGITQHRQA